MALIKIIPSPLSRKFNSIIDNNVTEYIEEENNLGQKTVRSLGQYKRERFPNSHQGERPISYSNSKGRYNLKNYEANSDELNELVKKCHLINDMPKHYDFNRPITTCDIRNINDPFFNHKSLKISLSEGYGSLDTENPLEYLLYMGMLANHRYQIGGENSNPALNARAKYIIVDSSIDRDTRKAVRDERKNAEALLDAMGNDRKKSIALAMGLIVDEDTDSSLINDLLEEAVLDNKTMPGAGMSKQKYFIKLASLDSTELKDREYVNKAFKKGLIRRDRESNTYVLFGAQIGKDKQGVINYLINPTNSETLYKLQKAIDLNDEE